MSDTASATADPQGGPGHEDERGTVGPRIQSFRRRAGLSQEAAASRAGISTRALRDIERGRARRPRVHTLRSLAGTLGLSDDELAGLLADARTGPPRDTGLPSLRPLLPGARGCAVVVTSRSRLAGLVSSDGARRIALDVLDPDEGRRLLGSIAGSCNVAAEEAAARSLVELCGGLPLAIRIAGANLVARNANIAAHCAELAGAGDGILDRLRIEGDRRSAVRSAFELSYRTLPDEARRMFRLLGQLPGPDLTVDAAAALAGTTPADSAALLARIADAHLVRERAGRFGLDVLLRSYARELIGTDEAHTARRRLMLSRAQGPARRDSGQANCPGSYASSAGPRA
ncbi:helix-turn-helix domain-containing protein [Streptomyces globisporus]|uniref:helix-turn-helix domain-containing protein n=1 Tax=Streptomyces globisporus TaxID=1908 RepID=UPI0036FB060B